MDAPTPKERNFERRQRAARQGLHLPSEEELLRGMGFFKQDLPEDVREYATRLSRRLKKRGRLDLMAMVEALDELVVDPGLDGIIAADALNADDCVDGTLTLPLWRAGRSVIR